VEKVGKAEYSEGFN